MHSSEHFQCEQPNADCQHLSVLPGTSNNGVTGAALYSDIDRDRDESVLDKHTLQNRMRRNKVMTRKIAVLILCCAATLPVLAQGKASDRLTESTAVLKTILTKQEIPKSVLDKAACVLVYPSVRKVGVGLGVTYGRGMITCRTGADMTGKWSAPAMYTLDTGSLGLQLGTSSTDYILFVMTDRGANKVLSGKLKLGADASAVAGPAGAQAAGFNDPNVDVLTYSQSKGLFAGAALGSASMASDDDMNKELYGKPLDAAQIVRDGAAPVPAAGKSLVGLLDRLSPKRN
jgi:SH3 domain-containing YSC84-like protein 1